MAPLAHLTTEAHLRERARRDAARHALAAGRRLRVAISGASGLVGGRLVTFLEGGGHEVWALVRRPPRDGAREIPWTPGDPRADLRTAEGLDAIVHLAGENIAGGRWTPTRKQAIRSSRVDGTRALAESLARLERPPRVLVSASAIGFYGDRGDELLNERSPPGAGFLPETCLAWEAATQPARAVGVRVVCMRIGVVLSRAGGALAKMLPIFRLGVGGPIGSGRQWMSWIGLDDLVAALHFVMLREDLSGAVNATAPGAVRQRDFARTLGRLLHRPAFAPLPALAVRLLMGEMGQRLLLEGARVLPARLREAGFSFFEPDLHAALEWELGRVPVDRSQK